MNHSTDTEAVPALTPYDTKAMAAVCAAFLAQDFLDQSLTAFEIGRRAKAILASLERGRYRPEEQSSRIKNAMIALIKTGGLTITGVMRPCGLNGAFFPTELRAELGFIGNSILEPMAPMPPSDLASTSVPVNEKPGQEELFIASNFSLLNWYPS